MSVLPTLDDQLRANLVTTITNSILDAIQPTQRSQVDNVPACNNRVLPSGVYMRENRHLYAAMCIVKNGKKTTVQVARGPFHDYSHATIAFLVNTPALHLRVGLSLAMEVRMVRCCKPSITMVLVRG